MNQIQWIDKLSDFWIRSKQEYHSVAHCRQYLTNRIWILTQSTHVETSCLRSDDDMIPLFPQWGETHCGIEFKCYACQLFHNADRNSCCKTKQLNSIATLKRYIVLSVPSLKHVAQLLQYACQSYSSQSTHSCCYWEPSWGAQCTTM